LTARSFAIKFERKIEHVSLNFEEDAYKLASIIKLRIKHSQQSTKFSVKLNDAAINALDKEEGN
jgi:hypothetical protein